MPIGLGLAEWDTAQGTIMRKIIPKAVSLSMNEINKILMSHSLTKSKEPEIIDFRINHKIIVSYCPKDKLTQLGYVMLIAVFHEDEGAQIPQYKERLFSYGQKLFELSYSERAAYFQEIAYEVFTKKSSRKMLFVGPSAVGKTSIKKIFFESASPDELLHKPLEPTYGLMYFNFDYFDLDLGIADLAGQEIEEFLADEPKTDIDPFDGCDEVIYVFDPSYWESNSKNILIHLEKIQRKLVKNKSTSHLFVFCHKIDLIEPSALEIFKNSVSERLKDKADDLFFTSIIKPYLSELIFIMQQILSQISERAHKINQVIKKIMKNVSSYGVVFLKTNKIFFEYNSYDLTKFPRSQMMSLIEQIEAISKWNNHPLEWFNLKMPNFNISYSVIDDLGLEQVILFSPKIPSTELNQYTQKIKDQLKIV